MGDLIVGLSYVGCMLDCARGCINLNCESEAKSRIGVKGTCRQY